MEIFAVGRILIIVSGDGGHEALSLNSTHHTDLTVRRHHLYLNALICSYCLLMFIFYRYDK